MCRTRPGWRNWSDARRSKRRGLRAMWVQVPPRVSGLFWGSVTETQAGSSQQSLGASPGLFVVDGRSEGAPEGPPATGQALERPAPPRRSPPGRRVRRPDQNGAVSGAPDTGSRRTSRPRSAGRSPNGRASAAHVSLRARTRATGFLAMDFEETLSALQGLLGTVVYVGVGPYEQGGPQMPAAGGIIGELRRAAAGQIWPADAGDEHVVFEVGDLGQKRGGYIALVRSIFKTAQWVDAPGGRELAVIQGPSHITVGPPPS